MRQNKPHYDPNYTVMSPAFIELLAKNGMAAHIERNQNGSYRLYVELYNNGQLAKATNYPITNQQRSTLTAPTQAMDYKQKQAYNCLKDIAGNDYDFKTFMGLTNAPDKFGRVVTMGQTGYYEPHICGCNHRHYIPSRPFVNFVYPNSGFNLNRIDGELYYRDVNQMAYAYGWVPEREGGVRKPGELASGSYGINPRNNGMDNNNTYGFQNGYNNSGLNGTDLGSGNNRTGIRLTDEYKSPYQWSDEKPIRFSDRIKTENDRTLAFSSNQWAEILESHGIIIDADHQKLVIQSSAVKIDRSYQLTNEEYNLLMADGEKSPSVKQRLDLINKLIAPDFKEPITIDFLNTEIRYSSQPTEAFVKEIEEFKATTANAEIKATEQATQYAQWQNQYAQALSPKGLQIATEAPQYYRLPDSGVSDLFPECGVYYKGKNGREVSFNGLKYDAEASTISFYINAEKHNYELTSEQAQEFERRDDRARMQYAIDRSKDLVIKPRAKQGITLADNANDAAIRANGIINGSDITVLMEGKGWYREGKNGREVEVGTIGAHKNIYNVHVLTAEIDGIEVAKEISENDYQKWMRVDDATRLKMASDKLKEIDIKDSAKQYAAPEKSENRTFKIDGQEIYFYTDQKSWYGRDENNKRVEVQVDQITIGPAPTNGKYMLTIQINGQQYQEEISKKDYEAIVKNGGDTMKCLERISKASDIVNLEDINKRSLLSKVFGVVLTGTAIVAGVDMALHTPGPPPPERAPGILVGPATTAQSAFDAQMRAWEAQQEINRGVHW
ncbi:MAG: hypothetical protein LIP09_09745 [Bacteroidales bacterium]|nr:hypothetical protein [Bacteroidales bacterium]